MTFDENDSLRYLMKEMDPSEEILFEQRMMEDEDLLIEVESLRNVYQRLSDLPDMNPPEDLSRKMVARAAEYQRERRNNVQRTVYLSAAATIVVAFMAGAYLVMDPIQQQGDGVSNTDIQETRSAASPTFPSLEVFPLLDAESSVPGAPSPWVDRNQELHFMDRFDNERAEAFDSLMQHSLERLQPRQSPGGERSEPTRGLHLTGQPN